MEPNVKVLALLAMLAEQTGEKISEARGEFMVAKLLPLGAQAVCQTLEAMLETARRFPTVGEIKAAMGLAQMSDQEAGRAVGERIYAAIARYGDCRADRQRIWDFIGPIGLEVVRLQGGWDHLCATVQEDDATTWKAQWRELATIVAKQGPNAAPPQYDRLRGEVRQALALVTAQADVAPKGRL